MDILVILVFLEHSSNFGEIWGQFGYFKGYFNIKHWHNNINNNNSLFTVKTIRESNLIRYKKFDFLCSII